MGQILSRPSSREGSPRHKSAAQTIERLSPTLGDRDGGVSSASGSSVGKMPDSEELERRFAKVLASMDLPPDKAKLLRAYDDDKKWEMIKDQDKVTAKASPDFYLRKLRTYLDPKASRSAKKRKSLGESTSTQVLRELEISLRTNSIEWVREFLSQEHKGLDVLIDYLTFRLAMQQHEQKVQELRRQQELQDQEGAATETNGVTGVGEHNGVETTNGPNQDRSAQIASFAANASSAAVNLFRRPSLMFKSSHAHKLRLGLVDDDVHVSIMCMRAIMNNKYGFNLVMEQSNAINCIALSLNHQSLRTKSLVLELLAAICLVKGGHQIILNAFDNFKEVMQERRRFQTLMNYFTNYEQFNIDFMVACMQFVNIIVHSVEDMNFRVHLQYEFTQLGLDDYLENKLRNTESEDLQVQIQAYLDNVFDVGALMEDAEQKSTSIEQCQQMVLQLSHAHELEREWETRYDGLERVLHDTCSERDGLLADKHRLEEDLNKMNKAVTDREEESRKRQSMLETKILQLEQNQVSSTVPPTVPASLPPNVTNSATSPIVSVAPPPPPPPPPHISSNSMSSAMPPPPPPPPPMPGGSSSLSRPALPPPPPPPPGMGLPGMGLPSSDSTMFTIKKSFTTKYKLPTFNWVPLKPNQVKGTIFNEFHDEEKIIKTIDFSDFEEQFKLGGKVEVSRKNSNSQNLNASKRFKQPEKLSMMENNRLRNMAISLKKLNLGSEEVIRTVNSFDCGSLKIEQMEILLRMIPNPTEVQAYREFERSGRSVDEMTDEDKFLFQITRSDRLEQKAKIIHYMANLQQSHDSPSQAVVHQWRTRIAMITEAARTLRQSSGIRTVLEYVLVFGNYLNSSTRTMASGLAYGFKLQTLDLITDTKSSQDRAKSLLHYVVDVVTQNFKDSDGLNDQEKVIKTLSTISPTTATKKFGGTSGLLAGAEQITLDNTKLPFDLEKLISLLERAVVISLETCISEVSELDKNMELAKRELHIRQNLRDAATQRLQQFVNQKLPEITALKEDLKRAQFEFNECAEYFGENPKVLESSSILFSAFSRFLKSYRQCLYGNRLVQRKKLEAMIQQKIQEHQKRNDEATKADAQVNGKDSNEVKVREKRILKQDEVYNGALEDILLGLKNEPYRRADAVRRSQRRKAENVRLSQSEMDI